MKLTNDELFKKQLWEKAQIQLPAYDREMVKMASEQTPTWVHFGAGNIFRGYIAALQDTLLNQGIEKTGITAVETFDEEIIEKIYQPHDNLTLMETLSADGSLKNRVIGSITEALSVDKPHDYARLRKLFITPSLQMVSFTITEKGYAIHDMNGNLLPMVQQDIERGIETPSHVMSIVAAMLYHRFCAGAGNLAVVSMDNCSHNGEKLKAAVTTIAKAWEEKGYVEEEFLAYLDDENQISFPWSMIDKITPRPAKTVEEQLGKLGIEDMQPIITNKNTYIAPYVNAEVAQYLVIEDKFPNGRPDLEQAGVYLTDRKTVNAVERMKVTTCLNPLHTALAIFGCLLGYTSISAEMQDHDLAELVRRIGFDEGMKVVTDPGILSPQAFISEVINERFPNPFMPDTPQRIATDTSQKLPVRFGETLKAYVKDPNLSVKDLTFIPLVFAGWLRYLLGVDDHLEPMELSKDPVLPELQNRLLEIETIGLKEVLADILSRDTLFGVNLFEVGLAEKVEVMFSEMMSGSGAVRMTLKKYLDSTSKK